MSVIFDYVRTTCFGSSLANFIEEKWSGELYDRLICKNCGVSRGSVTSYHDLQLQVRGQGSLEKSLESFSQDELLDEVECNSCQQRGPHLKGMKIRKLPYALSLQLKRFDLDWNTLQKVKVQDQLSIPFTLNMARYVESNSEASNAEELYDLLAVLVHSGSAYAGHYCCYIREPASIHEDGLGKWYLFNDSSVTDLTANQLKDAFGIPKDNEEEGAKASESEPVEKFIPTGQKRPLPIVSCKNNAYMLLYRKRDSSNIPAVSDELIPSKLKDIVSKDNDAYHTAKTEWEYERQFLNVKVTYEKETKVIKIHQSLCLSDLNHLVWQEFFQAESRIKPADISCIRLRQFDTIRGVLLGALAKVGENPTLSSFPEQVLRRTLYIDVKDQEDAFRDDDGEYIPLEMVTYIPTTWDPSSVSSQADSFSSPIALSIDANATIADLRKKVLTISAINFSDKGVSDDLNFVNDIVICRMNIQTGEHVVLLDDGNYKTSSNGTKQLSDNLIQTHVKGGDRMYVDLSKLYHKILLPEDYLDMLTYFDKIFNMLTIQYHVFLPESSSRNSGSLNYLGEQLGTVIGGPMMEPLIPFGSSRDLIVDARQTFHDLKVCIAKSIQLDISEFSLCRSLGGVSGKEFKDMSKTVRSETPPTESVFNVSVLVTTPLTLDQVRVSIYFRVLSNVLNAAPAGKEVAVDCFHLTNLVIRKTDTAAEIKSREELSDALMQMNHDSNINTEALILSSRRLRFCTIDGKEKTPDSIVKDIFVNPCPSTDSALDVAHESKANTKKVNLKEVLRDSKSISSILTTRLIDGSNLLLEIDMDSDSLTYSDDDLWIRVVVWNQRDSILSRFFEFPTSKTMTYKEFKQKVLSYDAVKGFFSEEVTEESLALAKPFTWQLESFETNLPNLKWSNQPKDTDTLSAAPWNLRDNSIILIKDTNRNTTEENAPTAASSVSHVPEGPELGFKLYSAQERISRNEAEAKELSDRKEVMEDKIKTMMSLKLQFQK